MTLMMLQAISNLHDLFEERLQQSQANACAENIHDASLALDCRLIDLDARRIHPRRQPWLKECQNLP